MNLKLAVPTEPPGGLEADISDHFGHCALFTLVSIEDGRVSGVETVPNVPHVQGGCLAPVNFLHAQGAQALIAGGMGMRPLLGFNSVGITVFHHQGRRTAKEAVESLIAGQLPQFGQQHTCGGGQDHQHGSGGCGHH